MFSGGSCQSGGVTVFAVNNGVTANLSNLTIQHGNTGANCGIFTCGGIFNNGGTLSLTRSTLTGNSTGGAGGGIYNTGMLSMTNSTLTGNTASGPSGGGGIGTYGGALSVTNSTISSNSASGGVFSVTVRRCVFCRRDPHRLNAGHRRG